MRYLRPELAWICRDPIGEEGGENLYQFAQNSPVSLCDILGLENIVVFVSHPNNLPSKVHYARVEKAARELQQELTKQCCGQHELLIVSGEDASADRLRSALSGHLDNTRIDAVFAIAQAQGATVPTRTRRPGARGLGGGEMIDVAGEVEYLYSRNVVECRRAVKTVNERADQNQQSTQGV